MPRPVSRGVAGALGGRVLVCGGRGEGAGHLAACHHLHLASSTWGRGPGLARGREDAASAVLGGLMVVTGGWDGARLLDSVEVFSSEAEQWQEVGRQQFYNQNHVTMQLQLQCDNYFTIHKTISPCPADDGRWRGGGCPRPATSTAPPRWAAASWWPEVIPPWPRCRSWSWRPRSVSAVSSH